MCRELSQETVTPQAVDQLHAQYVQGRIRIMIQITHHPVNSLLRLPTHLRPAGQGIRGQRRIPSLSQIYKNLPLHHLYTVSCAAITIALPLALLVIRVLIGQTCIQGASFRTSPLRSLLQQSSKARNGVICVLGLDRSFQFSLTRPSLLGLAREEEGEWCRWDLLSLCLPMLWISMAGRWMVMNRTGGYGEARGTSF